MDRWQWSLDTKLHTDLTLQVVIIKYSESVFGGLSAAACMLALFSFVRLPRLPAVFGRSEMPR